MFAFRIGSIPVRVHFMFFLTVAMFGAMSIGNDPRMLLVWVAFGFVAVLLHELGHALIGMRFGLTPQIDLIGFGGLTSWTAARPVTMTTGRRVAISIAGPMVSVVLGAAALAYLKTRPEPLDRTIEDVVWVFINVNLGWGIFNLLPIMPMDGGNVLFAILQKLTNGRGEAPARIVSVVLGVGIGLASFVRQHDLVFPVLVVAFFVLPHVRWFQARRAAISEAAPPSPRF